jgi:ABC-type transport system involved in multi-copper enzyme maturation permease subunit
MNQTARNETSTNQTATDRLSKAKLWWAQIRSVIRLEMRKTFFARRGLWIYILALLPLLLFIAHSVLTSHERAATRRLAQKSERRLTYADLLAIKNGMTGPEVVARLGKPPVYMQWKEQRLDDSQKLVDVNREEYRYSDGSENLFLFLTDGEVSSVQLGQGDSVAEDSIVFASVFQFFYLRLAIFFGCLGIFMNLFRGEVLDKSLHFYFLAPIRREVLMVGKFLAGLLATCTIFVTSELLQLVVFSWQFPPNVRDLYLYQNHGLAHAAAYLGVTVLACLGYGAFFLAAGMLFRNPILPAAAILVWEAVNPFLPALLKKFSVIYYLKSLCPVDIPSPPGTSPVMSLLISNPDPVSAPVAILGIVIVSMLVLYVSSFQARRMEINYTTE